jgi:AraC family transcriptional regulator
MVSACCSPLDCDRPTRHACAVPISTRIGPPAPTRQTTTGTSLHFVHADSGEWAPDALERSTILASSRALGWDGLVAEMGCVDDWQVDDLTVAGHFVAINLDSKPLTIENKGSHGFRRIVMPPDSLWLNPAGESFTRRNPGTTHWGAIEVCVERMQRTLGRDIELDGQCGVVDEQLAGLIRAALAEARSGGTSGTLFADSVGIAIASRLAHRFGRGAGITDPAGALAPRLKSVLEKIEDSIADRISVDDLAALVGVSPAHFAREFKRLMHETPHGFVMRRRAERAREKLSSGSSIAEAASGSGFSDQAHLSRVFKDRFGVTPGAFRRLSRQPPRRE